MFGPDDTQSDPVRDRRVPRLTIESRFETTLKVTAIVQL